MSDAEALLAHNVESATRPRTSAAPANSQDAGNHAQAVVEDFYMENGFVVFTAAYHLRRGYCCNSGCRHCPYGESSR